MKSLVNRVSLIGVLGKDPETTEFENGKQRTSFSIATHEYYTDDKGDRVETTDWHRVVVWGKLAGFAAQHLRKGKRVALEGKLSTHSYEKEGETKYITEVIGHEVIMLTPKTLETEG